MCGDRSEGNLSAIYHGGLTDRGIGVIFFFVLNLIWVFSELPFVNSCYGFYHVRVWCYIGSPYYILCYVWSYVVKVQSLFNKYVPS